MAVLNTQRYVYCRIGIKDRGIRMRNHEGSLNMDSRYGVMDSHPDAERVIVGDSREGLRT